MTNSDTILVTGGSGFIGSHLIAGLFGKNAEVVNLDTKEPVLKDQAKYWIKCDVTNLADLHAIITRTRPRLIYNLAAHASLAGGPEAMQSNVTSVKNLLEVCAGLEGGSPLLIHTSTQLVAGPAKTTFDPENYYANTTYGESKIEAEKLIRAQHSVPWTIIRPTNIWGSYHPSFATAVWKYINQRVYLHPAGFDVVRSYGYVGNVVEQLIRISELDRAVVAGNTFYVGDEPIPSAIWLDAFSIALTNKPVRRVPMWALKTIANLGELSGKVGGPSPINIGRLQRMTSDFPVPMQKTHEVLGRGSWSLDQGVVETVKWLRQQQGF